MASFRAGVGATALALALAACGNETVPPASCSFFPDDCPDELQCSLDTARDGELLCDVQGLRATGEACDSHSSDRGEHCGRDLLCLTHASSGAAAVCTPLCLTDEDCTGEASRCVPSSDPEFTVCALR